jgi:hypothetical protein
MEITGHTFVLKSSHMTVEFPIATICQFQINGERFAQ